MNYWWEIFLFSLFLLPFSVEMFLSPFLVFIPIHWLLSCLLSCIRCLFVCLVTCMFLFFVFVLFVRSLLLLLLFFFWCCFFDTTKAIVMFQIWSNMEWPNHQSKIQLINYHIRIGQWTLPILNWRNKK